MCVCVCVCVYVYMCVCVYVYMCAQCSQIATGPSPESLEALPIGNPFEYLLIFFKFAT
jgi:hypothetical protein